MLRLAMMRNLIASLAIAASLSACSDACRDNVVSTEPSPDGAWQAVLFQRDCGATTGFSSQVSVTRVGAAISGGGNTFVADDDHGNATKSSSGGPWVELRWLSPQRLLIRYDKASRVFTRADTVSDISVTYEAVTR